MHGRRRTRLIGTRFFRAMIPATAFALGVFPFEPLAVAQHAAERHGGAADAIEQHFARALDDGCRYEATLHGSIRRVRPSPRSGESERLAPDLSIEAEVHCGRSSSQQPTARTLASTAMTVPQLLDALGRRGAIVGVSRGRICTFTPEFALEGMRFRQVDLRESCERPTFGGGPRDRDWRDWR